MTDKTWVDVALGAEPLIRMGVFLGMLVLMASLEALRPRRTRMLGRLQRWPGNLALVAAGALMGRLVLAPLALLPVGLAIWAEQSGWGLLTALEHPVLRIGAAVLLLDLAIYAQHVAFHAIKPLWSLHRMHHADLDYDTTTGLRFHPLEIFLSALIKGAVIVALGAPPIAVLIFEVVLNGSALFNHANFRIPPALDRVLRLFLVTPDMHRVHHSTIPHETHSNFGFCFPWWDRIFRTYQEQPEQGHEEMAIGLPYFRAPKEQGLLAMLSQPWRHPK